MNARAAGSPDWEREGRGWPNRESSRFVDAAGLRWHVQRMGSGPVLLLVHGTGSATHSWRSLLPLLAESFTVVAPDLPGHGFTQAPPPERLSLPGMALALKELLRVMAVAPELAVGHSAGAAILARMCLDGLISPRVLISINGALLPLRGLSGMVFSPAAKLIASSSLVPRLFAWRAADRSAVERLIRGTGSVLDAEGVDLYWRLVRNAGHVGSTLAMMANWDLQALMRDFPALRTPLALLAGSNDRTIAPSEAQRIKALLPDSQVISLPGLGHLAHEERPGDIAALVERLAGERPGLTAGLRSNAAALDRSC